MNYDSVKKVSDIKLEGITVELDKTAESLNAVTFFDKAGNQARVSLRSYNMYLEVPAAPKKKKQWRVTASVDGASTIPQDFEQEYEANNLKRKLEDRFDKVEVTEVEVEVND